MNRENDNPEVDLARAPYARRLRALMEAFRRDDGTPWHAKSIERASKGAITSQYIYTLRDGKVLSPSHDKLRVISSVMGFPMLLWDIEPEEWVGQAGIDPREGGATYDPEVVSARARRLAGLHKGGQVRPIAERLSVMCSSAISAWRIEQILRSEADDITASEIGALSMAFGVAPGYWAEDDSCGPESPALAAANRRRPPTPEELDDQWHEEAVARMDAQIQELWKVVFRQFDDPESRGA